ncbi:DUF6544 family protein [Streptosporangium sp. NPDC000396]|uniref:DUF6544 family protein n=1 Tax=Streptosporangium sp. NPDC000396 TaxID=3366185 RepID=UPI0036BE8593
MNKAERSRIEAALLARLPAPATFTEAEIAGLPAPVRKHLGAAIAPGTPLAVAARLRMRGGIKLGGWLPFHARQVLVPHRGFVWTARVAALIAGSDHYAEGRGGMDWKAAGLVRLAHAEGDDVSRSCAERAGAEACWIPTSLLPRFGAEWSADDDTHVSVSHAIDGRGVRTRYELTADGRIRSFVFDRWGDPGNTGSWGRHPFGGEITAWATFGGITIPSAGRVGWFFGTDRWADGEFFRYRITRLQLVTPERHGASDPAGAPPEPITEDRA